MTNPSSKEKTIAEIISVMESARDDGERNCQDLVRIHVGHISATIDVLKQLQSSPETTGELREAALQDIAYRNGAQQALAMAHQSLQVADKWLAELWERSREARAVLKANPQGETTGPQLEWEVTYDVVAYNESWGGYGDSASKSGFRTAEEAINYAKPLGAHLAAVVWKRTKPMPVAPPPSEKIWSAVKATGDADGR